MPSLHKYNLLRVLAPAAFTLILQSCSTATQADFVGEWSGKVSVREKLPGKETKEYEKPMEIAIMPDPDNPKAVIVFYKSMPLTADIKRNKFVIRDENRQKLSPLFTFLGLMAGKAAELSEFSITGKLSGSETMDLSWDIEITADDQRGRISMQGELRRTSSKPPLKRLLSP
ncbi:MAG: hypothetical protein NZZ60_04490 [Bacteroidia bacterium]|nr:hypothetical protein [Bacteroidia bacterium]MCX7652994.1 hypothetical protein [Bacteroidia bacterium]MDW8416132.1 hypothetical protein [Bacteroidia bacterium]